MDKDRNLLNMQEVRDLAKKLIDTRFNGFQSSFAKHHKISEAYVSDVLAGRREPGEKFLAAVKLSRVLLYRKTEE